ncbi:hypothetical protein GH808_01990 [Acetobacterium fimetarium]|uniref:Putative nitroreductase TM1586 domain-containing protein n=1 Tax=Acetobacterium fimetarium TaxID=52691 RepID=A0ABR6WRM5_9FIRM|nr:nitroreductase family protein [Acetobacterium fimetarium]MBC3803216.1 hypothetical protein [Acetobacterium fimetarium]
MDYKKAIEDRRSRRSYLEKPINDIAVERLQNLIEQANEESGLHLQLCINNNDALSGVKMSYGMFKNVRNYIALVGKKSDLDLAEKIGYYGERIVLEAKLLKLDTCWVGGSYKEKSCQCDIGADETLRGIITIGHAPEALSFKEKAICSIMHRKTKKTEEMLKSDIEIPEWILDGMKAVQRAPSAVNQQPVQFIYKNGKFNAFVILKLGCEMIDLGIAKLHFEIGADNIGKWKWGNSGEFVINKTENNSNKELSDETNAIQVCVHDSNLATV